MTHAIDTNIAIYAMMARDPAKMDMAFAVMRDAKISVQVLSEFTSVGLRKFGLSILEVDDLIEALSEICDVEPLTSDILKEARRLTGRYKMAYYDAQIVAMALHTGCSELFSEDGQHGQEIEGMAIKNPFIES